MSIKTFLFLHRGAIFLFFSFFTSFVYAEESFFDSQINPGLVRAQDTTSVKTLGLGLVSILVASTQDNATREHWQNNQQIETRYSNWGDRFGTYGISFMIIGGQWIWDRDNGKNHLRALAAVTVVGTTLKVAANRERPNQANRLSFPSGHTYGAFATATSLTYAYGWKAAAVMFPVATFVGLSRVADNEHWLSDVVGGAFLGFYLGRLTYYEEKKSASLAEPPVAPPISMWLPLLEQDKVGLRWSAEF